jgi:hypothetical protein
MGPRVLHRGYVRPCRSRALVCLDMIRRALHRRPGWVRCVGGVERTAEQAYPLAIRHRTRIMSAL